MKINLRKANALQLAIQTAINETEIRNRVTITRFDDPHTKFSEASLERSIRLAKKISLVDTLYDVRELIAQAGNTAGVSKILSKIAEVDKKIEMYSPLSKENEFAPDEKSLSSQFNDMIIEPHNSYHRRRDSIEVSLVGKAELWEDVLNDLRLKKQKLSEDLLEENVSHSVTLPEYIVNTLKKYGLV